jgi:transcription elongation factor Elf1
MTFGPSLQLSNGPECPRCGCRESEITRPIIAFDGWFARQNSGQACCGHCGLLFSFSAEEAEPSTPIAVPETVDEALEGMECDDADRIMQEVTKPRDTAYPVRGCPECGEADILVYRTMQKVDGVPRVRYHRCRACGETFKSADSRHFAK